MPKFLFTALLLILIFPWGAMIAQDKAHKTKIIRYQDLNKVHDPTIQVGDQTRMFEVRLIRDSAERTPTSLRLKGETAYYYLDDKVQLSLEDVDSVTFVESSISHSYHLLIALTPDGREKLAVFSGANLKKQIGIIIENKLMEAPRITGKILDGHMSIPGLKSLKDAESLARSLNDAKKNMKK
jgi:preprotein translocase subunit SecD